MTIYDQLIQFLVSGLTIGSIYALIALGFVTIYNVTGIINFAQGEFAVYGALVAVTLYQPQIRLFSGSLTLEVGWPLLPAAVVGALAGSLLGLLLYRFGIQPARKAAVLHMIIITIGAAFFFRGVSLLIWGTDPYRLPPFSTGPPFKVFGAILTRQSVWVMAVTVVLLIALYFFFNYTVIGKALRACAVNPKAARLMGINPHRMALLAFGLSAGITAIAGIVITPATFMTYDRGLILSLKGFVAAIIGGLSSPLGAVLGGLLLGILESFGAGLVSSGYKDAIAFVILFVVLAVQVGGLLRRRTATVERDGL